MGFVVSLSSIILGAGTKRDDGGSNSVWVPKSVRTLSITFWSSALFEVGASKGWIGNPAEDPRFGENKLRRSHKSFKAA
jgi:hypothetical protein